MTAPNTSKYILSELNVDLPNGTVLSAEKGLGIDTEDGVTFVAVADQCEKITSLITTGLIVQNDFRNFITQNLTAGTGIGISQDFNFGANPVLAPINESIKQPIYVTDNSQEREEPFSTINFIDGRHLNLSFVDGDSQEISLIIDAKESTIIDQVDVSLPPNFPTQVFSLESNFDVDENIDLTINVNFSGATNNDILWTKIAPNPGVEWAPRPDGVKSFDMTSATNLINITFSPDVQPTEPNAEAIVTITTADPAQIPGSTGNIYVYDGTDVVFAGTNSPISSIEFDFPQDNIFLFSPSVLAASTVNSFFTFDDTNTTENCVIKAVLTAPNTIDLSYVSAVQSIGFNIASNISDVFTLTDTTINYPNNNTAFLFNTASALNNQFPLWDGTDLIWSSGGLGTITQVGMAINSNSTDVLTFTGTTPIKSTGTFSFGYNFSTSGPPQTPPSSTVQFDGTKATWKQPANSFITIVAAGQMAFPSGTGTPSVTVYTGWNPASQNLYWAKTSGVSRTGITSVTGNLTTNIVGANPTLVNIVSDTNTDWEKWFTYILYYITPAS